jgi:LCP family protein required for cell wall assembly
MDGEERPKYTKYRARPGLLRRRPKAGEPAVGDVRGDRLEPPREPRGQGGIPGLDRLRELRRSRQAKGGRGARRGLGGITVGRVVKWLVLAALGWALLSFVVFLISAQIEQGKLDDATEQALDPGPFPLTSPTNILVLGSDQRSEQTAEPGSSTSGPSRSDSILLIRTGGGANSRLSIARDTMVDIPGSSRQKINAAYAIGGPALAIETIKGYLGIEIHHLIQVSFADFPELIDAMGGIDYEGPCVVAKVNGGARNGGVTLRIRDDRETHLNGKRALALARVRKNDCRPNENDLHRAARQQRVLSAMRSRALSPAGFVRGPLIGWQLPKTIKSDMAGPTLSAVMANLAIGGTPETHVLGTVSGEVPDELRAREVRQFLEG